MINAICVLFLAFRCARADAADLSGLSYIRSDYRHRILIGGRKTSGHGVGKINELGAEVAKEDADKVIDAIRTTKRLSESDAFLLIAGAAGGTGSGNGTVGNIQVSPAIRHGTRVTQ